jgi:hypothetical protein
MASATASLPLGAQQRRGRVFVALAAVAWSTAGILQRELTVGVGMQVGGRALFAVLGLLGYVAVVERGAVLRAFHAVGRAGLAVAALMAIASGSFIVALNHASVANILFMQALSPVLAAVFGMLVGEPVSRRTWLAMAVALGGVGLMVGGPFGPTARRTSASTDDGNVAGTKQRKCIRFHRVDIGGHFRWVVARTRTIRSSYEDHHVELRWKCVVRKGSGLIGFDGLHGFDLCLFNWH